MLLVLFKQMETSMWNAMRYFTRRIVLLFSSARLIYQKNWTESRYILSIYFKLLTNN